MLAPVAAGAILSIISQESKGDFMKVIKIDHIGIAVTSLNKGKKFWGDILGL